MCSSQREHMSADLLENTTQSIPQYGIEQPIPDENDGTNLNAQSFIPNPNSAAVDSDAVLIQNSLSQEVSNRISIDIPAENPSGNNTIDEINSEAAKSLLNILNNIESERLKQQKPLRNWLLFFLFLQLVFFNAIVMYVIYTCTKLDGVDISEILDFLKYYMAGSLAELIAMVFLITKSTFVSIGQDIVKGLMNRISKS